MAISTSKAWAISKDQEALVLKLIKKILGGQQVFQLDDYFVNYCSKKSKLSELHVYKILYSLVKQKIIVPGTILTRDKILENKSRSLIFDKIKKTPGIHIRELCEAMGKSSGLVRAHLAVLESFAFIRIKNMKVQNFLYYS